MRHVAVIVLSLLAATPALAATSYTCAPSGSGMDYAIPGGSDAFAPAGIAAGSVFDSFDEVRSGSVTVDNVDNGCWQGGTLTGTGTAIDVANGTTGYTVEAARIAGASTGVIVSSAWSAAAGNTVRAVWMSGITGVAIDLPTQTSITISDVLIDGAATAIEALGAADRSASDTIAISGALIRATGAGAPISVDAEDPAVTLTNTVVAFDAWDAGSPAAWAAMWARVSASGSTLLWLSDAAYPSDMPAVPAGITVKTGAAARKHWYTVKAAWARDHGDIARISGDPPPAPTLAVQPPRPPMAYIVPTTGVTNVSTSAAFEAAITSSTPKTIVLADGAYSTATANGFVVAPAAAHKIYAQHHGGAVLKSGLTIGGDAPGDLAPVLVQGLDIDLTTGATRWNGDKQGNIGLYARKYTVPTILDVTIDGDNAVDHCFRHEATSGAVIRRMTIANCRKSGIRSGFGTSHADGSYRPAVASVITDLNVRQIEIPGPKNGNGTSEACFWFGNDVMAHRLKCRDAYWMGLWTGTSITDSVITDVDIDDIKTVDPVSRGVYAEHKTTNVLFQRIKIGNNVDIGFLCEPPNKNWPPLGSGACTNVTVRDSTFLSNCGGVNAGSEQVNVTVWNSKFGEIVGGQRIGPRAAPHPIGGLSAGMRAKMMATNDYGEMPKTAVIEPGPGEYGSLKRKACTQ